MADTHLIEFSNTQIHAFLNDNKPYLAVKPICESLGINWNAQYERIRRDEVLSSSIRVIRTVAPDGKNREYISLPLNCLNGWLFGICANRIKDPVIRDNLITYRRECYDVLFNHFYGNSKPTPKPSKLEESKQTLLQMQLIAATIPMAALRDRLLDQIKLNHALLRVMDEKPQLEVGND